MAYPRVAGHPNYSGAPQMIPEIWSSKLQEKFYADTPYRDMFMTDYEGEISDYGDKVHIRTTPDITIFDHSQGQSLNYETPARDGVELLIDRGKAFAFKCDDVVKKQSDLNAMNMWSRDAARQMQIEIHRTVINAIPADVAAVNQGAAAGAVSGGYNLGAVGSPFSLTKNNVLDFIVDLGSTLDEQNVPREGRWLNLPSWAHNLLRKSDIQDASLAGDRKSIVRGGPVGMIDDFMLYKDNLITPGTDGADTVYNLLAGHKSSTAFAAQMNKVEDLRLQDQFGDAMRGLMIFGFKVIQPRHIALGYVKKG